MSEPYIIPCTPDEVTTAWLTAVLHDAEVLRHGRVAAVRWERIGADRGFSGVVARLHMEYADITTGESPPLSLIAKFPLAEQVTESTYRAAQRGDDAAYRRHFGRCTREVRFYEEIATQCAIPVPRLYYGGVNAETDRIALLLEDLRDAREGDVLRGCSPDEALPVLRAIAAFHARWWESRAEYVTYLPRWSGDHREREERYRGQIAPFLERFGDGIPNRVRDLIVRLGSHYAVVLGALAGAPATVVHADLHLDNCLFNPPGREPRVILLDWQSVSRGPAAVDVALFLFGSLDPIVRGAAEDGLLGAYHTLLASGGVTNYTRDDLSHDCRLALLWMLAGTVGWLARADLAHTAGRERLLVDAAIADGRLITALLDHDVASLLPD